MLNTTVAILESWLQTDRILLGVACEGWHGRVELHVAAARARDFKHLQILNPAMLDSEVLTEEFCGACHRGFEQVLSFPNQDGINNIRYQPYRLCNSRGHNGDARISGVACHNPHDRLVR